MKLSRPIFTYSTFPPFIYSCYIFSISIAVICFLPVITAAFADYVLPPVAERYIVLVDSWKLSAPSATKDLVEVNHAGKTYLWPINRFLLADRTQSDTICTGTDKAFTRGYLDNLSKLPPKSLAEVELVNNKAGAPLMVAGIWAVDFSQKWQKACQYGSRALDLPPEEVKKLGSASYKSKLLKASNEQWLKLIKRPIK